MELEEIKKEIDKLTLGQIVDLSEHMMKTWKSKQKEVSGRLFKEC